MTVPTDADRARKLIQQQQYRLARPSVNGRIRGLFDTVEEYYECYDNLFAEQGGKCKICKKQWQEGDRRFHMDHDHETLEIRGLLCFSDNQKLGWYEKWKTEIEEYLN